MPLSLAELNELRSEFFCDDVSIPAHAVHWERGQAIAFFESGGTSIPSAPQLAPQPDAVQRRKPAQLSDALEERGVDLQALSRLDKAELQVKLKALGFGRVGERAQIPRVQI